MTSMKCGCQIITDSIQFEKRIYDNNGMILHIIHLSHRYQQYVNVCGSCINKEKLFNNIEKTQLKLAKEQFEILTEENTVEPEPED